MALADDSEFRLGEQLQQIGARRAQADLDDPVGHGDDLGNRAQCVLERIAARAAQLLR